MAEDGVKVVGLAGSGVLGIVLITKRTGWSIRMEAMVLGKALS